MMRIANKLKNEFIVLLNRIRDLVVLRLIDDWLGLVSFFKKLSAGFNSFCNFISRNVTKKLLYLLESKEFEVLENLRERIFGAYNDFLKFCKENPIASKTISGVNRGVDLFFFPYD
jgi:hypothetical protein